MDPKDEKKSVLEEILEDIEEGEEFTEGENGKYKKVESKGKKEGDDEDEDDDEGGDDEKDDKKNPFKKEKKETKKVKKETKDEKDDEKKVSENLEIDIKDDVDAILKGTKLSEDHAAKVATIFETALRTQVRKHVEKAEGLYEDKYKKDLKEAIQEVEAKVDQYMDHVAENWMEENKIAVEQGIRADLVEAFVKDFKALCEEHNVEISDDQVNALDESLEEVKDLEKKLDESMESNIAMKNELSGIQMKAAVEKLSEGMVETDKEKFIGLVEDVEYKSSEDYSEKLKIIKENYFKGEETINEENDKELAGTNNDVGDKGKIISLADQAKVHLTNSVNR